MLFVQRSIDRFDNLAVSSLEFFESLSDITLFPQVRVSRENCMNTLNVSIKTLWLAASSWAGDQRLEFAVYYRSLKNLALYLLVVLESEEGPLGVLVEELSSASEPLADLGLRFFFFFFCLVLLLEVSLGGFW